MEPNYNNNMTNTDNPIDNDNRLRGLLSKIGTIQSKKEYKTWLKAFLKHYTKHLDPNGILNGKDGNYRLLKQLEKLGQRIELVMDPLQQGEINTTNGRRLLTNLTQEVKATEVKVDEFMPKTSSDEERFGFDKFELAAVLLEDGFYGYDSMNQTMMVLESIALELDDDNSDGGFDNELAIIHSYSDSVESFIDVMADLKLLPVMNRCVNVVYKGKDRPPPKPPPPPEENDDMELPEDESITSMPDEVAGNGNYNGGPGTGGKGGKKKKKKKKSKSKSPVPSKKKKKDKKKGGAIPENNELSTDDEDESFDNLNSAGMSPGSNNKSKFAPTMPKRQPSFLPDDDKESSDDDDSSDLSEDDDDEDGQDGPPQQSEFLLFFDPITNTVGRVDREKTMDKSGSLLADKSVDDPNNEYEYKNVITNNEEKNEITFLLKKLERQKPEEESWLDAIKREKAEAAKNGKKPLKKARIRTSIQQTRRGSGSINSPRSIRSPRGSSNKHVGVGTATLGSGGSYKSPLLDPKKKLDVDKMTISNPITDDEDKQNSRRSTKTNTKKKGRGLPIKSQKKNNNKTFKQRYSEIADKPDSDGWSKPASSAKLLI